MQEDAQCVGNFNKHFCNHWFSHEALVMYIMAEAEQQRFGFPCPTCKAEKCPQCEKHNPCDTSGTRFCHIPQAQIRALLTPEQLEKCVPPSQVWLGLRRPLGHLRSLQDCLDCAQQLHGVRVQGAWGTSEALPQREQGINRRVPPPRLLVLVCTGRRRRRRPQLRCASSRQQCPCVFLLG